MVTALPPLKQARAELVKAQQQRDEAIASTVAALLALKNLLAVVERIGGYMAPEHRIALDVARATLVEAEAGG